MTARELPPEEWPTKLTGTSLDGVALNPIGTIIIVVEDEADVVVGCWAAFDTVHVEGVWIREDHRKRGVAAGLLLNTMKAQLRSNSIPEVLTNADTPEVEDLLRKIGAVQLPGTCWVLSLAEE